MISGPFQSWEHALEVRDHGDEYRRSPGPGQHEMISELGIGRRHELRVETQRRETVRRQATQAIDAFGICGVTIDAHHLPQHLQRCGHLLLEKFFERGSVRRGWRTSVQDSITRVEML